MDRQASDFELWLEEKYPGRRCTDLVDCLDDMEAAFLAGFDAGHAEATNHLATGGSFK